MKKQLYIVGLATAILGLSSCNGDYDDWANPQSNPQEDAITVSGYTASAANAVNLNEAADSVQLFALGTTSLPQGYTVENNRIVLTPQGEATDIKDELSAKISAGKNCKVDSAELQALVANAFGKKPVARSFKGHVYSDINANGEEVWVDAGEVNVTVTPAAPVLSTKGYYLVGNFQGWKADITTYSYEFGASDPYANPVMTFKVPRPEDATTNIEFKILDLDHVGDWSAATVLTPAVDKVIANDGSETATIIDNTNGNGYNIKFKATSDKYYEVTVNLLDQTISATTVNDPELYLTGDQYNWGATWLQMTPVNKNDEASINKFWKIMYLHAGELIKFAPQAGWGNDFYGNTINDEAGAGAAESGGNLKITNAGWYTVLVNRDTKEVSILTPKVYLIGEASNGGWGTIAGAADQFTTPTTEDGLFVSPAFVQTKPIRMAVVMGDIAWWRSEFVVNATGAIIYRGNGGDPESITVTAGQKAYLNFKTNKGEYK